MYFAFYTLSNRITPQQVASSCSDVIIKHSSIGADIQERAMMQVLPSTTENVQSPFASIGGLEEEPIDRDEESIDAGIFNNGDPFNNNPAGNLLMFDTQ